MKRSSWVALVAAVLLLGGSGVLLVVRGGKRPTPEQLIRQSLRDVEEAGRKRSVGGVMSAVSKDYKDAAGFNKDRLRLLLARAVQDTQNRTFDVRVTPRNISFLPGNRDQATVVVQTAVVDTQNGETIWGGDQLITLVMRRESRRKWLVFSDDVWRVVGAANLPPFGGGDEGGGLLGF